MENLSVKALVQLLGINEHTLRSWERRYKAIRPVRSQSGRRLYADKDIERIRLLLLLVERGHAIGNIAAFTTAKLRELAEQTGALPGFRSPQGEALSPIPPPPVPSPDIPTILKTVCDALEAFDLQRLSWLLQKARFDLSPRQWVLDLVAPLMGEVGRRVDTSQISVAQEHIVSALIRDHLGQIYQSLSPYELFSKRGKKKIVLATPESDLHEFGIYLAAILCALHECPAHYLGANLPAEDLISAANTIGADYVIVGISRLPDAKRKVPIRPFLRQVSAGLPSTAEIWIGGSNTALDGFKLEGRPTMTVHTLQDLDFLLRARSH